MARSLATVEQLTAVRKHPNADALELANVRGWQVVTRLGEFGDGDLVVYFEIDTLLPTADERFAFLAPRGTRTDQLSGLVGHVLRTVRLRGELSQGLVLPLDQFPELGDVAVGADVTDALGLIKWDPPLPANLSGQAVGPRPDLVPKTDAERVQNLDLASFPRSSWVASEKIDGTSTSYLLEAGGSLRVCTRNLELASAGQAQWRVAEELGLTTFMDDLLIGAQSVVLQGELAGPSIQSNPLNLPKVRLFLFRVLVDGIDVASAAWPNELAELAAPALDTPFPTTADEGIEAANALKSQVSPDRAPEGIVWRYEGTEPVQERMVKAISNTYLLKQKG